MLVLGGISGSSLDGLDLALIEISEDVTGSIQWSIKSAVTKAYTPQIVDALGRAPQMSARDLYELEAIYSQVTSTFIQTFIKETGHSPDLIGWHGHTIFHDPEQSTTLQIGHGSHIAAQSGIATIGQFRLVDLALGGEGAPLAPLVEVDLLPASTYFANLGGICNISKHGNEVQSADVVACNQLLNRLAQRMDLPYDDQGLIARGGTIIPDLLDRLQKIDYHQKSIPKSMDNSWVLETVWPMVELEQSTPDALCTVVEYNAREIARFVEQLDGAKSGTMAVHGGGAYNTFLLERIAAHLQPLDISIHVPDGTLIEFKEATLMAYMAYCFFHGRRNVLASVTGSKHDHIGGCLYQGSKPLRLHA